MNGSGRLSRLTATLIGLSASTSPATVAAATPNRRRTVAHSTATDAAPAIALGSRRLQLRVAEHAGAERLDPQRDGRLVDGDEPAGVERVEEEVVPLSSRASAAE